MEKGGQIELLLSVLAKEVQTLDYPFCFVIFRFILYSSYINSIHFVTFAQLFIFSAFYSDVGVIRFDLMIHAYIVVAYLFFIRSIHTAYIAR